MTTGRINQVTTIKWASTHLLRVPNSVAETNTDASPFDVQTHSLTFSSPKTK